MTLRKSYLHVNVGVVVEAVGIFQHTRVDVIPLGQMIRKNTSAYSNVKIKC